MQHCNRCETGSIGMRLSLLACSFTLISKFRLYIPLHRSKNKNMIEDIIAESRFSPAGSVRARLWRANPGTPFTPAPSSTLFHCTYHKEKAPRWGCFSFVVEARRIELLSENKFTGPSPSAVNLLKFPPPHAGLQAYGFGSFMMHDAFKALRVHVRH